VRLALWQRGFRPFFLLAAAFAVLRTPLWLAQWTGVLRTAASGVLAAAAAALLAARMSGWRTLRTRADPLVWSLHAGYAWLALGFACIAAGDLGAPLFYSAGVHALTAGAFGAMILAVATRVALGHTGRPLAAPRGIPSAYALVSLGALLRVVGPIAAPAATLELVVCGGLLWS
jgi:uncharacterized protein involved in response to NO